MDDGQAMGARERTGANEMIQLDKFVAFPETPRAAIAFAEMPIRECRTEFITYRL